MIYLKNIVVLSGDGIGNEIMKSGLDVLEKVSKKISFNYNITHCDFGGIAIEKHGVPLPQDTLEAAKKSDAILLSAIGDPKYNGAVIRPEQGLLDIRKKLHLFVNVRPLTIYPTLANRSPIKNVDNVDFVVIRELTGGIYFGKHELKSRYAIDESKYTSFEIERVIRFAFETAKKRRCHVTSVDKENVLSTSKLWRSIADKVSKDYPEVELVHQLVDSMAMLLITDPKRFDVIVTENLFGDILSDEASAIAGSLGVMASSSHGLGTSIYEPIHGSAPDIAGKGVANPIGMIVSIAMMLRDSFREEKGSEIIENAIIETLKEKIFTPDLGGTAKTVDITKSIISKI